MSDKRDWKRPFAWGIAAFIFASIVGRTPAIDIQNSSDVLLVSFLFAFAFAVVAALAGILRTAVVSGPSRILIPFFSASFERSLQAMAIWLLGMIAKVFLFDLGLIGVVVMLVAALAAVQRLWPDQAK